MLTLTDNTRGRLGVGLGRQNLGSKVNNITFLTYLCKRFTLVEICATEVDIYILVSIKLY